MALATRMLCNKEYRTLYISFDIKHSHPPDRYHF